MKFIYLIPLILVTFVVSCSSHNKGVSQASHQLLVDKAEAKSQDTKRKRRRIKRRRRKPASKKKKSSITQNTLVKKLQKRQAKRLMEIDKYKVQKVIGEREDGLLGIYKLKKLNPKEIKEVKALVAIENKDRERLYKLIIKDAGYNKKEELVLRKSFFDSYQEWAPKGTYYYKDEKWQRKY